MTKNLRELRKLAKEVIKKQGEHLPQLMAYTKGLNTVALLADFPSESDKKTEMMLGLGAKLANQDKAGKLQETYFIVEAWLGDLDELAKTGKRPSEQEKKREVLLITGRIEKKGGSKSITDIQEIIRDKTGKIIDLQDVSTGWTMHNTLLDAFAFGYKKAHILRMQKN